MSLFVFQPELLSTINIILGLRLGTWAATLIFSILFVVLLVLIWFIFRKKFSFVNIIISAAFIAWLPLFLHFSYNSVKEFNDTWFVLFQPESEQIIWRYCRIDKYQNLNGNLCSIYPFVEQLKKNIPKGSTIAYVRTSSAAFISYFLYQDFNIVSVEQADYLILFRPYQAYTYENGILYEDAKKTKALGKFKIIAFFGPDQIVFKKQ